MSVCRLNWAFSHSFTFLNKATGLAVIPAATPIEIRVFAKPGGATLKVWTSAQGYFTAQANGRIVFSVPAAEMAAPLTAGSLAFEMRRTDTSPATIILQGFLRVGEATSS